MMSDLLKLDPRDSFILVYLNSDHFYTEFQINCFYLGNLIRQDYFHHVLIQFTTGALLYHHVLFDYLKHKATAQISVGHS